MRKIVMSVLLVAGLVGCATNGQYGNYADASLDRNQKMAEATVSKLVALYPPAQTRFKLQQPTTDSYGVSLVQAMRDKGYALLEYAPQEKNEAVASPGLDLRYVVDAPISTNLYRVTVLVGEQSISRAFTAAPDGKLYPAGVWVRKE
ncbi:MAG: conjugal transfer protein TrbH [Burkholderiaceae bacterium]